MQSCSTRTTTNLSSTKPASSSTPRQEQRPARITLGLAAAAAAATAAGSMARKGGRRTWETRTGNDASQARLAASDK